MDGLPPGAAAVSDFAFRVNAATSKSAAWRPLALQTKPASFAPVGPVGKAKAKALMRQAPVPLRIFAKGAPGRSPGPPAALPYHQRHSGGECKCYDVWFDNLRDLKGWEAMEHIEKAHTYRARRCQFVLRTSGCRKGDQCEYCHVHGVDETTGEALAEVAETRARGVLVEQAGLRQAGGRSCLDCSDLSWR